MKISVALCTFNGERFLPQQLESIEQQSRQPDEFIVCDDGSTDRTFKLLNEFAKSVAFPVRITRNSARLGPAQNFGQAIGQCTGTIISLCDQDDIWHPDKLAVTAEAFIADPKLAYVFSDAEMCDASGNALGYRLWSSTGLKGNFDFDLLLRQNVVTGATLSFSSTFRSLILPIDGHWMHDGWIALLLSAVAKAKAVDQPLIQYRQHASQSVGAEKRSLYQQYLNARAMDRNVFANQADAFEAALARLQEQTDFELRPEVMSKLQAKIAHSRIRSAIRLGQKSKLAAFGEVLRYLKYGLGWKSFAQDLFL